MNGTCVVSCEAEAAAGSGAACPMGTTCQLTNGYCAGTACSAPRFMVCR
jgi:hypothetical protein